VTDRSPHLLIAFDGSEPARHAIELIARLAPGARATVVTVRDAWDPLDHAAVARLALPDAIIVPAAGKLAAAHAEAAEATAAQGAQRAAAAGLESDHHVEQAPKPWRGIVAAAHRLAPDLIVCGARGHGGLSRALLGTTSDALLHHAPAPVLIVPAHGPAGAGPVLVGYDGSGPARDAIALTARLFPRRAATIVNAWSSPLDRSYEGEGLVTMPLTDMHELVASLESVCVEDAERLAAAGAATARELGLAARPVAVACGGVGAWHALLAAADQEDAAAIVVGSRGRGAIASTVLGSVSAGLAHNAARPVLVAGHVANTGAMRGELRGGSAAQA
jgi:nucleotide-binding universal stress UspA family protein